ncbi:hypothetical protein H310_08412 [Aphanomyces invadans]|uniref:Retrotransposon gag domain-containing protein n=1 Tax=Aphanomyces invadans TaxID=157072 RepID=A0A024TY53_9STRA|nr:hypothetical protein H310_08412 [Aphanomyces invadans]ETV98923.1 hypothetical protein H310_08412 [Aphanomyces invadans]|eukprot:XP_008872351.1 hypothetical protein H310_08412 [Aphanomyces invadans]
MEQAFAQLTQTAQVLMESQAKDMKSHDELMQQHLELKNAPCRMEMKVEGLSMPKYHGKLSEGFSPYAHLVNTFFDAKNMNRRESPEMEERCLVMVVANFRGQAAAWYQDRQASKDAITALDQLSKILRHEFEPEDLQERLRDSLYSLTKNCKDLQDVGSRATESVITIVSVCATTSNVPHLK